MVVPLTAASNHQLISTCLSGAVEIGVGRWSFMRDSVPSCAARSRRFSLTTGRPAQPLDRHRAASQPARADRHMGRTFANSNSAATNVPMDPLKPATQPTSPSAVVRDTAPTGGPVPPNARPMPKSFDAIFRGGAIYLRERVPAEAPASIRHLFAARRAPRARRPRRTISTKRPTRSAEQPEPPPTRPSRPVSPVSPWPQWPSVPAPGRAEGGPDGCL